MGDLEPVSVFRVRFSRSHRGKPGKTVFFARVPGTFGAYRETGEARFRSLLGELHRGGHELRAHVPLWARRPVTIEGVSLYHNDYHIRGRWARKYEIPPLGELKAAPPLRGATRSVDF